MKKENTKEKAKKETKETANPTWRAIKIEFPKAIETLYDFLQFYTTKDKLLERIDVKILEDPFKLLLGLDLAENVSSALNIQDEAINLLTPCSSKAKRVSG